MKAEIEAARDAAIQEWKDRHNAPELGLTMHDGAIQVFSEGYDAGHSDGYAARGSQWVAVNSADDLPEHNGRYVTQDKRQCLRVQDYTSHRISIWLTDVVAYLREPIEPYTADSGQEGE